MFRRYSPFVPPYCVLLPSCSLSLAMILCFGVPTTYLGARVLASSLTLLSACALLLPLLSSCSPLASLAPVSLPLLPLISNGQTRLVVYYTIFRGPHHLCRGKGQDGSKGVREEQEGARGARQEQERSKREQGEQDRSEREQGE